MEPKETNAAGDPLAKKIPFPKKLDAIQLRDLAEVASSLRSSEGEAYYAVVGLNDHNELELSIVSGKDKDPPTGALFEIDTTTVQNRHPVDSLVMTVEGQIRELAKEYDALFWTESAVEKFVFPYYASKSGWAAAEVLRRISCVWYRKLPLPSPDPLPENTPFDFSLPVAIAHLPDSDWTPVANGPDPYHDLHVVLMAADGLKAVPLAEAFPPGSGDPLCGVLDPAPRKPAGQAGG